MTRTDVYTFPGRRWLLVAAGACGLLGFLLQYGTYLGQRAPRAIDALSWLAVGLFLVETVLAARALPTRRLFLRRRWPALLLALLLAGELVAVRLGGGSWLAPVLDFFSLRLARTYVIVAQFYILGSLLAHLPHLDTRAAYQRVRPGVLFLLAFALLILLGSLLLLLPRATSPAAQFGFGEALFTSTSAVCVTGLVVVDTATGFTGFGQTIILLLVQLGGLGIMSLTATLSLLLGRGIGIRESSLLREVFQVPMLGEVGRTLRFIVLLTLMAEVLGAGLLWLGLDGVVNEPGRRLFVAIFHSVSAFCNAGFSTFGDSLVGLRDNSLVMGTVTGLLVLGGIGFAVVANLLAFMRGRALARKTGRRSSVRLNVNTRLVLMLTVLLLAAGTVLILAVEWEGALAPLDWPQKVSQALFQSATARTAGFNSLDLTTLSRPTLFLLIVLMFVGAAPGSTAGGVKVTVIALIWANLRAIAHGWRQPRLLGREVEPAAVHRALLVLSAGLVLAALGTFVLLLTEGAGLQETVFEVFSALGTVGLSLGLTGELSGAGRLVVIALMFIGRLGPLTLAYGLVRPRRERQMRLPRGRIMVG